jgi:hypothetical protein
VLSERDGFEGELFVATVLSYDAAMNCYDICFEVSAVVCVVWFVQRSLQDHMMQWSTGNSNSAFLLVFSIADD